MIYRSGVVIRFRDANCSRLCCKKEMKMWIRTALLTAGLAAVLCGARAGAQPVQLTTNTVDSGFVVVRGPAGSFNVLIGSTTPERGGLYVCDENGDTKVALFVDPLGDSHGHIVADVKNFRTVNPRDPSTDIVYACIEGPEAAAYVRGTARLVDGVATVELPSHFTDIASSQGLTVQVTPLSADSRGLAVTAESRERFTVQELFSGRGTYEFHWQITAVRRGFEQYEVIEPRLQSGNGQPLSSVRSPLADFGGKTGATATSDQASTMAYRPLTLLRGIFRVLHNSAGSFLCKVGRSLRFKPVACRSPGGIAEDLTLQCSLPQESQGGG